MGPELMLAATIVSAVGTAVSAAGQASAMKGQAAADRQRAAIEAQWAQRRALEERAAGQRAASSEQRKGELAQSRLTTLAGASGGGTEDPTIQDLWGDIGKEADYNAAMATAGAEQKAAGITYQADLGSWAADANARIKSQAANTTLIGGLLSSAGQIGSGLAARYGRPGSSGSIDGTGYGGWDTTWRRYG